MGHFHGFGQEKKRPGELRTHIVIALTADMMAVEITAGNAYGSIATLLIGKYFGALWMNPVMGLVSATLLDMHESDRTMETISNMIQASGEHRVMGFHLWSIGFGLQAARHRRVQRTSAA